MKSFGIIISNAASSHKYAYGHVRSTGAYAGDSGDHVYKAMRERSVNIPAFSSINESVAELAYWFWSSTQLYHVREQGWHVCMKHVRAPNIYAVR